MKKMRLLRLSMKKFLLKWQAHGLREDKSKMVVKMTKLMKLTSLTKEMPLMKRALPLRS